MNSKCTGEMEIRFLQNVFYVSHPAITHLLPAPLINETAIFNKGNHVSITSSRRVKAAK